MLCVTIKIDSVGIVFFAHNSISSERRFSAVSTSSAENGSSMNKTSGCTTSARANPTLCRMPPESSFGYALWNPSNPTVSRIAFARSRRSSAPSPRAFSGASTFSRTVNHGNSAKLWNTIETLIVCEWIGLPCQKTSPPEGFDSPASMRSSVDLPEPEGPSSATISPATIDRSVGAITWMRFSLGCA